MIPLILQCSVDASCLGNDLFNKCNADGTCGCGDPGATPELDGQDTQCDVTTGLSVCRTINANPAAPVANEIGSCQVEKIQRLISFVLLFQMSSKGNPVFVFFSSK